MPAELARRIALVTGGTSGIGRATVLALAQAGCSVALTGRDAARGGAVVAEVTVQGGTAIFLPADLRRPEEIDAVITATVAHFGRLDIAFNNAGYQEPRAPLAEQSAETYDRVFDTNVRSVVLAMQRQIAVMREAGGVIINNASVSGQRNPNPGLALYAASKAALLSLTRSAAMECAPLGIRINAISPGRIETPMMLASGIADMASVAASLPARRLGKPEEVAAAVVWLVSPAAAFVIGHNLCVDGGFLAA